MSTGQAGGTYSWLWCALLAFLVLHLPTGPARADLGLSGAAPASLPSLNAPRTETLSLRLGPHQTVVQAIRRLATAPGQARAIVTALASKFPFRRARPGDELVLERLADGGALRRFTYRQSAAEEWTVEPGADGALRGERRQVRLTTEVVRVDVTIRGSIWESLQRLGEDPALAAVASDVLEYDVDFFQDVRAGDRLQILVEKVVADDRLLRYGSVIAAAYDGAVAGHRRLYRYTDANGFAGYYDELGRPARRSFLRAPVPFARVTSGFGSRVHPLLGYRKAHQGVDYGAAQGTPVWAVGDGTVAQAGWRGACGKSITLRHRNGLETVYCHLSAILVKAGAHVQQKQEIGRVGRTGLATGPHLHFAVRRAGSFVNPLRLQAPAEPPLEGGQREEFLVRIAPVRAELEAMSLAGGGITNPASRTNPAG